jgi:RHO1 GDP-GTP exchange protein 1/2
MNFVGFNSSPSPPQDLRLQEEGRELIYKGALNKRGGVQGDSGDLQLYLFDHALLMVKQKSKHEQYKVYRRVSVLFTSRLLLG